MTNSRLSVKAEENPKIDSKYEKNATYPALGHANTLKLQPKRVSHLCLRSAYLHLGNALQAMGKNEEAREMYSKVFPLLADEPRCGRLDWERSSVIVNIGNTYSREGDFETANEHYNKAEQLGKDHVDANGNIVDGMGIMIVAMRNRAFALKKAGKEEEAKKRLKEVLELQLKLNVAQEEQKKKEREALEKQQADEAALATPAEGANGTNGTSQQVAVN